MDDRTRDENESLRELFQHPGWKVLMRNSQAQLDQFRQSFPFNVNTLEQLYFARGMTATLQSLVNMEQQLEAQEAEATEDPNALNELEV